MEPGLSSSAEAPATVRPACTAIVNPPLESKRDVTEFNELTRDTPPPKSQGWRRLNPPVPVRAYFAQGWHDVLAVDINDDTRELRVEMPPERDRNGVDLISHRVFGPSLYQADAAALRA